MSSFDNLTELVQKVVSKCELPKAQFALVQKVPMKRDLVFELIGDKDVVQPTDSISLLERTIQAQIKSNLIMRDSDKRFYIDVDQIVSNLIQGSFEDLKLLWLRVNNKSEWKRTKLAKKAKWGSFPRDKVLDLWIDALEHGILDIDSNTDTDATKKLKKFFAKQFENLGANNG